MEPMHIKHITDSLNLKTYPSPIDPETVYKDVENSLLEASQKFFPPRTATKKHVRVRPCMDWCPLFQK